MEKSYKYRIYPTKEQVEYLLKASGMTRMYWNLCLERKRTAFEKHEKFKIPSAKSCFLEMRPEAVPWYEELDSTIFSGEWNIISTTFNNYYKQGRGKRKTWMREPHFKSKKRDMISVTWNNMAHPSIRNDGYLFITKKLGLVKGVFHRWAYGKFKHATISQTSTGKWFVSICVEKQEDKKNRNGKSVGIDWNCRDDSFLVESNGTRIKCPRFLKRSEVQLQVQQRRLSRKFKKNVDSQSSNYYKQRRKVAVIHEKVSNQRKDWLHKLSRHICDEYQTVVMEDINMQTMASNLHHGKVVNDQGIGMFRQMVKYKGELVLVPPFNTSKSCSVCGYVNPEVVLGVDEWTCPKCGTEHDRDVNSARNILAKYKYDKELSIGTVRSDDIENACGMPKGRGKQEIRGSLVQKK